MATGAVCPESAAPSEVVAPAEAVIPAIDVIADGTTPPDACGAAPHAASATRVAITSGSVYLRYFTTRPLDVHSGSARRGALARQIATGVTSAP
jgi:hypothetical protein